MNETEKWMLVTGYPKLRVAMISAQFILRRILDLDLPEDIQRDVDSLVRSIQRFWDAENEAIYKRKNENKPD